MPLYMLVTLLKELVMQFTKKTAQLIEDRANGYCEFCLYPATEEMQIPPQTARHGWKQRPCYGVTCKRRMGSLPMPPRHRRKQRARSQHGYLVYQHKDPREVPVMMPQVTAFGMLDDEGDMSRFGNLALLLVANLRQRHVHSSVTNKKQVTNLFRRDAP